MIVFACTSLINVPVSGLHYSLYFLYIYWINITTTTWFFLGFIACKSMQKPELGATLDHTLVWTAALLTLQCSFGFFLTFVAHTFGGVYVRLFWIYVFCTTLDYCATCRGLCVRSMAQECALWMSFIEWLYSSLVNTNSILDSLWLGLTPLQVCRIPPIGRWRES